MDHTTETSPAPDEQGSMAGDVAGADTPAATTEARTFTQEQVNEIVKARLAEERAKLTSKHEKEFAAKLAETMTAREQEFETQLAARITAALAERDLADARRAIQAEYGLSDAQLARLTGETVEALKADAETLFGALKARKPPVLTPGSAPAADEPPTVAQLADPKWVRENAHRLMPKR